MSEAVPQLGRVFVSSVFRGMLPLRAQVAEAARRAGLEAVLTENFVARPEAVRGVLAGEIASCDTYVGIFDRLRGTVPASGTDGRAITEEELRLARELGLRCLVFLSRDEAGTRDPLLSDFLDRHVSDYETGVWARPWSTPDELRREVVAGLAALRPRLALELRREGAGLTAWLDLSGVQPAWRGEAVLGPVAVDLDLSRASAAAVAAFQGGGEGRSRLSEAALRAAGLELTARAFPGALGEALDTVLELAGFRDRLAVLEVVTGDDDALALPWELVGTARRPFAVRQGALEVVRRIPPPGGGAAPAASLPADFLEVLGFTASPDPDQIEKARPGAGGIHDSVLFWEAEQEKLLAALDGLLREGRGRLVLPDTGDREVLREHLARENRPQVVHVACHGSWEDTGPVLILEDHAGQRSPLGGPELLGWLRTAPAARPIELLVLAACSTAGARRPAGSEQPGARAAVASEVEQGAEGLAAMLVRGGLHRVLGMQGTISDAGATAFAGGFYTELALGGDLVAALRRGRAELAPKGSAHEWAVPVLTLSWDAGPLVAPGGPVVPGAHAFEAARESFRIGGVTYLERGYVGRREAERALLHAYRRGEKILVLHGLGGIGKSTFAARFLERRRAEEVRVLVLDAGCRLVPAALAEEVARQVGAVRPAGAPEEAEKAFRQELGRRLAEEPTVLLLDNFEDNQHDVGEDAGRLLDPELGEALAGLAKLGGPRFQLLLTTRYQPVDLPGPYTRWCRDLGELSKAGCRKLRLLDPEGLGKLEDAAWNQALFHFGGHPKALDLLGGWLRGTPDAARRFLAKLEPAGAEVEKRLAASLQERGRQLLIEDLLDQVPDERRPAFDRLCLLEAPLPGEELEALLAAGGVADPAGEIAWLRGRGLLARKVADSALEGGDAVHRLLASRRLGALAEQEGEEAATTWHREVAEYFTERPGPLSKFGIAARHLDAAGDRAGALGLYNRWALSLRDRHAYAACIAVAREGLEAFPAGEVEGEKVASARLWQSIHEGLEPLGELAGAEKALNEAERCLGEAAGPEARYARASGVLLRGRLIAGAGQPRLAEQVLLEALDGFTAGGHSLERAVTLGDVARLRAQAGDVLGALALHEERLEIFEQLGVVRERAMTLGDVAHFRARSGDVSGALALYEEIFGIIEQLGDVQGRAVMLGHVAFLRAQSGDISGALALHEERLEIFEQLGAVRERAVTLGDMARLRSQSDDASGALALHEERLVIFEKLGDVRSRAITLGDVARHRAEAGDVAGARKLQVERLEVNRKLGDVEGIAAAQFDLALLDLREQQRDSARDRLAESWEIVSGIGRADAVAAVGKIYGMTLAAGRDREQAAAVWKGSLVACQRLGWEARAQEVEALLAGLAGVSPS